MKRAKSIAAMITVASLLLGSVSVVMAANTTPANLDTDATVAAVATAAPTATAAPAPTQYADLAYTQQEYYSNNSEDLGAYPVVTGMSDLSAKILDDLFKCYTYNNTQVYSPYADNTFGVSFKVENNNEFAKITVTYSFKASTISFADMSTDMVYYVDKATMTTSTADAWATAQTAATATTVATATPAPTAVAEEAVMVPLRKYAEQLGYTVKFYTETQTVKLTKGDFVTAIVLDENEYTVNNTRTALDAAPTMQDGTVYVPVSFFEKVLGATVTSDNDGTVQMTFQATK